MEHFCHFLSGVHLRFIQVTKSTGPMEQLTICLLGFPLGFPLGFIYVIKSLGPMEQLTILGFHLGFAVYNSKKVKNGKRPTCMKSAEGSLFRQIFPKI